MARNIQAVLGARIRELRKKREWSQEDLAAASGMHWTYIGQVERVETNISLVNLLRIAEALEIGPDKLVRNLRLQPRTR